jgi:hypothetical protein
MQMLSMLSDEQRVEYKIFPMRKSPSLVNRCHEGCAEPPVGGGGWPRAVLNILMFAGMGSRRLLIYGNITK